MGPANFPGLIVNGFDHACSPESIISARPAISAVCRFGKINGVSVPSGDDEQSSFRIETWRTKVGCPTFIGSDKASIGRRFFIRVRNWTAFLIHAVRPIHRHKRHGEKTFSICPVQYKEVTVTRGLHQHLARLTVKVRIHQYWNFYRIPIMSVVWRWLKSPG